MLICTITVSVFASLAVSKSVSASLAVSVFVAASSSLSVFVAASNSCLPSPLCVCVCVALFVASQLCIRLCGPTLGIHRWRC